MPLNLTNTFYLPVKVHRAYRFRAHFEELVNIVASKDENQ